jgi:hypothetical protein
MPVRKICNLYAGMTEQADSALFGRTSYELLNNYWPSAKDLPSASKGIVAYSNLVQQRKKNCVSKTMTVQNFK